MTLAVFLFWTCLSPLTLVFALKWIFLYWEILMELLPQLALNFVKLAQVHRIVYDYSRAEWVNGMVLVMI